MWDVLVGVSDFYNMREWNVEYTLPHSSLTLTHTSQIAHEGDHAARVDEEFVSDLRLSGVRRL